MQRNCDLLSVRLIFFHPRMALCWVSTHAGSWVPLAFMSHSNIYSTRAERD
nr:MAG TPA: hypothetical protein [Caudoviricetes sp.]